MKKKRLILVAALVVAAALLARFVIFKPEFRYAGTLEATRVDLSSRVATVIGSVEVDEGWKIRKGQLLVSLTCEDIRIAQRLAKENYDRAVKLRKSGTMSQESFDQFSTAKQDADTRLSWCDIQAPTPGTVLSRLHEPGEWVNPGTKILSVANLLDIWAYIYVPQEKIARLKPGMKLTGYLPELGDRAFQGTIRKISDEAEFTPKNVQTRAERTRLVFGVKIGFENAEEILKPGMTIEVKLPED